MVCSLVHKRTRVRRTQIDTHSLVFLTRLNTNTAKNRLTRWKFYTVKKMSKTGIISHTNYTCFLSENPGENRMLSAHFPLQSHEHRPRIIDTDRNFWVGAGINISCEGHRQMPPPV